MNHPPNPKALKIIWFAFTGFSTLLYLLPRYLMAEGAPDGVFPNLNDPLTLALTVVAVIDLFASFLAPRLWAKGSDDPSKGALAIILRYVLLESMSLIGFILAVLKEEPGLVTLYAGTAIFLLVLNYPTSDRVKSLTR